ncbi:MATH domain and coiled-coil domain-containing protein [Populus alba x Populus x berolinensis]|nr:MATH domain and coiled-coil domain-containing protein [Populus alba x Populus x berolinensis]
MKRRCSFTMGSIHTQVQGTLKGGPFNVQTPCLIHHFGHESAKENKKEKCDSMNSGGLTRSKRDLPPMHYTLKIESFSLLLKTEVVKYESDVFEAEGYTWRLCLYPNGNTKGKGKGFVSLYLQIENTSKLGHRWKVTTEFKLFVFDQINDKYLTVRESDASVKSFHEEKTEWGFDKLLSLETFNDASNGYLFNDCCVFGAEIFVIKPTGKGELLSMVKKPANGSLTWKIEDFCKLDRSSYLSKAFTSGGRSWRIKVYPKGYDDGKGNSLSVYLELVDGGKLPRKKTVWAEYKLRVLDQRHGKHVEEKKSRWFTSSSYSRGFPKFMPLGDLREVSKGYVKSDTLIVEAEILTVSVSKLFSY